MGCVIAAEIMLKLGRKKEATTIYRELINRNPENWAYYKGYEDSLALGKASAIGDLGNKDNCSNSNNKYNDDDKI